MSDSDEVCWADWFCSLRGNEFFCTIHASYLKDNFNLTGLAEQIPNYEAALSVVTDMDAAAGEEVELASVMLYGLVHARYILTPRGIDQMVRKYEYGDFGFCPRVYCNGQPMLPIGLTDKPGEQMVKTYCPKCVDVYTPKSSRHHHVDGAYFGTGFPHMLFMTYPQYRPQPPTEHFVPRLYGFKIYELTSHKSHQ